MRILASCYHCSTFSQIALIKKTSKPRSLCHCDSDGSGRRICMYHINNKYSPYAPCMMYITVRFGTIVPMTLKGQSTQTTTTTTTTTATTQKIYNTKSLLWCFVVLRLLHRVELTVGCGGCTRASCGCCGYTTHKQPPPEPLRLHSCVVVYMLCAEIFLRCCCGEF